MSLKNWEAMFCPALGLVPQHLKNVFDVLELKFMLVVVVRLAVVVVGFSHSNTRRWSACPSDLVLI